MELNNKIKMNKIAFFILLLCVFTNCSKDSYDGTSPNHTYYYPTDEASISATQIGDGKGTLDPKGIAIANNKLYVCNGDVLEVFNANTLVHLKTISNYTKGASTVAFAKLTSVSIDNGRIYIGSAESRLFVIDEVTNAGISMLGNGQWWNTFVHVFGVVAKDGLVFVKEKETSIKVFLASQITDKSEWNLAPFAKLNTLKGFDEVYSMDVADGNLVVAGRNAKGYLYYNIAGIRANATASLKAPIQPVVVAFNEAKPLSVAINADWAVTSENEGNSNFLRLYPKKEFMDKIYKPRVNSFDIMGQNNFGSIVSVAQLNDHLFLSDNTNKKIRVIKLNKSEITEQR
ncbi:hypothetical protein [Flavobacterium sp. 140616W15]|uniref:hypothetical protein n=1 Tax=Flavobacterium sp. 140616W15 TaxID=2478552 RepID=UPI000F0C9194|nr:hypothetical protein [Flavobacterium sp. 140616W15]AYN04564.1 hypothetical protein EAG11_10610 [Flavobacterium sp. 140616W15]